MTKAELIALMEPLIDHAEIMLASEEEQRIVPIKATLKTSGRRVIVLIEPLSWVERGGDV